MIDQVMLDYAIFILFVLFLEIHSEELMTNNKIVDKILIITLFFYK